MMEAAVVVDLDGKVLYEHAPHNRTVVSLPDSRSLWDVIWENRDKLSGIAHSHPGSGKPGPSYEDVTTFADIEAALGRRLNWWIITSDQLILLRWAGPEKHLYAIVNDVGPHEWRHRLHELSNYPAPQNEGKENTP